MGMMIGDNSGEWIDFEVSLHQPVLPAGQALVKEKREKYSFPFGDLEFVQIQMPEIYIVYGDMFLKEEKFRMRTLELPPMIELHFAIEGKGSVQNMLNGKSYAFNKNQHNIMYLTQFDGTAQYESYKPFKFFEVHFSVDHFLDLAANTNQVLSGFIDKILSGKDVDICGQNLQISFEMHQCIHDIMDCRFKGGLKLLYLQAKCIELLALQAEAFEKHTFHKNKSSLTSSRDQDCIIYAREYLLENITNPPSLTELAAIAGTNTFKLKNGFKELFQTTVFGYLNDVKLKQAKELLQEGLQIKDVASQLGYSSVQHFSTAFRKKFNLSPGKLK